MIHVVCVCQHGGGIKVLVRKGKMNNQVRLCLKHCSPCKMKTLGDFRNLPDQLIVFLNTLIHRLSSPWIKVLNMLQEVV